jgi:hypothetical protein
VAREGDDTLEKAVGEVAYTLSLEHGVLLCEHVVSTWRSAQMRARQEFIYKNVVGEGVDLWSLVKPPKKRPPGPTVTAPSAYTEDFSSPPSRYVGKVNGGATLTFLPQMV